MKKWQLVGIGTLLAGLPTWMIPSPAYNSSLGLGLACMILITLFSAFVFVRYELSPRRVILSQGLAFVLATLIKIAMDTTTGTSDHNLFPFELVFAAGMGFIAGIIGVGAGMAFRYISR